MAVDEQSRVFGANFESQPLVRGAQRVFRPGWRWGAREDESEIARAVGRRCDELTPFGGDGDQGGEKYILYNLGLVARDRGDLDVAERLLSAGLSIAQTQSDQYLVPYFVGQLGAVSLRAHNWVRARQRAGDALAMRRRADRSLETTGDLATLAFACLVDGETSMARENVEQALAILDESRGEGAEEPQRDYYVCSQVLSRIGDVEGARRALRSAYDLIIARADRISDSEIRDSFLQRVPINRQIVEQARKQGLVD